MIGKHLITTKLVHLKRYGTARHGRTRRYDKTRIRDDNNNNDNNNSRYGNYDALPLETG